MSAFTVGSSIEIDGGNAGAYIDMVNNGSTFHAVYYNESLQVLQYSTCSSNCETTRSSWTTVTIDSNLQVGKYNAITRDAIGRLHVSYFDNGNNDLKYATCASSCTTALNWTTVTVDSTGVVGQFTDIDVDSANAVHVSYYDGSNFDLKYATCASTCTSSSNWTLTTIDGTNRSVGQYSQIEVDTSDDLHILYYDATLVGTKLELDYITCTASCTSSSNWTRTAARISSNVLETGGLYVDFSIDSSNVMHATYQFAGWDGESYYYNLEYSSCTISSGTCASSEWSHAVVDSGNVISDGYSYSSITKDSGGNLITLYYNTIAQSLKFKTCLSGATCTTDGGWTNATTIDSTSGVGQYVALTASGTTLYTLYYDSSSLSAKFGTCTTSCATSSNWTLLVVDPSSAVGESVVVKQDSTGRFHAVYYDTTNQTVKYATCASSCNTSSNWTTSSPLTTSDAVGSYVDLVIDSSNVLYIAYYNATAQAVEFSVCGSGCTSSSWTTVRIYSESGENVGAYTQLVQGTNNAFHVVFNNDTLGTLEYVTCTSNCLLSSSWSATSTVIDGPTNAVGDYASLAISGTALHVAYYDSTNTDLRYATCASSCTTASNWNAVTVDGTGVTLGQYASLDVDSGGDPHIAYATSDPFLKYAYCSTGCTSALNWTTLTVDNSASVGKFADLHVDAGDNVHVSYFDDTSNKPTYGFCENACVTSSSQWTLALLSHQPFGAHTEVLTDTDGDTHLFYTSTALSADTNHDVLGYTSVAHDDDGDGYTEAAGDCNDASTAVNPGATETADGADNDCDNTVDEGTVNYDDDGDGFCETGGSSCVNGNTTVGQNDEADADNTVYPGATELADGKDNDQDGTVDEGTVNYDDDGDGFCNTASVSCVNGSQVSGQNDSNDADNTIYPSAAELADGKDNDQDGTVDEGTVNYDDDDDGYCNTGGVSCVNGNTTVGQNDADDTDDTVYPSAPELADGKDNDQDSTVDEGTVNYDDDGDGFCETGGSSCVNGNTTVGQNDGNDSDNTIYPSAPELEDNKDNDQDSVVDEGTNNYDDDGDTQTENEGDCNDADAAFYRGATEVLDNIDNDCDSTIDEGIDDDNDNFADAQSPYNGTDCNDTNASVYPGATELADGFDNDCDGVLDEGTVSVDDDGDGYTEVQNDCNDTDANISPADEEVLNNAVDDNCNGEIDESADENDNTDDGTSDNEDDGTDTNEETSIYSIQNISAEGSAADAIGTVSLVDQQQTELLEFTAYEEEVGAQPVIGLNGGVRFVYTIPKKNQPSFALKAFSLEGELLGSRTLSYKKKQICKITTADFNQDSEDEILLACQSVKKNTVTITALQFNAEKGKFSVRSKKVFQWKPHAFSIQIDLEEMYNVILKKGKKKKFLRLFQGKDGSWTISLKT